MTTRKRTEISLPENVKSPFHGDRPFFNRELSWLAFNQRVLEQATNPDYPLLERVRFVAFVSSNLDEFFEIRVAGLMQKVESGITRTGLDGLEPKEQLKRIRRIASRLVSDQYACWNKQLVPDLKKEQIVFKKMDQLTRNEMSWVKRYFEESVFPVLTPLAIDPGHPFPQITNKSLNILACIRNPEEDEEDLLAILPVPRILPRIVEIPSKGTKYKTYVFMSDVIGHFTHQLFPGFETLSTHAFRVTRNSDLYIDEEEVENLLQTIEEELHKLKKGASVRLEIADSVPEEALDRLLYAINLTRDSVFRIDGPINLLRVMGFYDMVDRPDLKFPPFLAHNSPALTEAPNIFDAISREDFLLHHPFESFTPVVEFLRQAGKDPTVYAIKQTLYRTSGDSPIIEALMEASTQGKQVTALIELKARFDEANNIHWARQLEDAGVHVVYGLVGLKTHCKTCLVIRREPDNTLRRFVHMGTGNYNPKTARLYTDYSYFTAKPHITEEVADLFNSLTGFARSPNFKHLLVAPFNLHSSVQRFIRQEATNAKAGKPARIIVKVNSLIDQETIESLYEASKAGVQIDLIVRGICGIIPGVKGLSENIRVRSILGRYLEHSRIYYFQNSGKRARLYVGSADWMPRNFFRRIEAVFPVEEAEHRKHLLDTLKTYLKDNVQTKQLRPSGTYTRVPVSKKSTPFSAQAFFMAESQKASQQMNEESQKSQPPRKMRGEPRQAPGNEPQKEAAPTGDATSDK